MARKYVILLSPPMQGTALFLMILHFLFFNLNSPQASTGRGIMVKVNSPSGKAYDLSLYSGYHALVIGCSQYKNGWPMLPNPAKDALEVAGMFKQRGWSVKTLLDPDGKKLESELNRLVVEQGKDPSKAILVWFSGHGHTIAEADGTALGYLVPVDAPDPERDQGGFIERAMSMRQIETIARQIYSKHVLMVFDSCFSGAIFQMVRTKPSLMIEEKVAYPVRQFITAGSEAEKVPDKSVFKDVFIQAINDGFADLNRDNYVTGEELGSYLYEQVINYSRKTQHPQFGKINNPKLDKGDFVFQLAQSDVTIEDRLVQQPAEAFLAVDANIRGAMISLDGEVIGRTPLEKTLVSPGEHALVVEKEGYEKYDKRFQFNPGWLQNISVVMEKSAPPKSRLYVQTDPENTVVMILNILPKFHQGIELSPGYYHLRITAAEREAQDLWVKIKPGEEKTMNFTLKRSAPRVAENMVALEEKPSAEPPKPTRKALSDKGVPGKDWKDPLTGMEFVWVPEGCFQMGCVSESKECGGDEVPVHEACLDGFWMGKFEVTLSQFEHFVKQTGYVSDAEKNAEDKAGCWAMIEEYGQRRWDWKKGADWRSPGYPQAENMPVVCVSWNDVQSFKQWLNEKSGKNYRLPTEAEWEYACRASSLSTRFWGDDPDNACRYANVADRTKDGKWRQGAEVHKCSDGFYHAAPVGSFKPNGFNLHDMLGNVWEWCEDVYANDAYISHAHKNPLNLKGSASRVIRGGCRIVKPEFVRSTVRYSYTPGSRYGNLGFRLVRTP